MGRFLEAKAEDSRPPIRPVAPAEHVLREIEEQVRHPHVER